MSNLSENYWWGISYQWKNYQIASTNANNFYPHKKESKLKQYDTMLYLSDWQRKTCVSRVWELN
jgi:hypothetical protein